MNNSSEKEIRFCVIGIMALLTGAMIYLLFRQNILFTQWIPDWVWMSYLRRYLFAFDVPFVKYYLVDYLWALSLSCGLHLIFRPSWRGAFICSTIVALYGGVFEWLQFFGVIAGTGDWLDVLGYILAGFTANILNNSRRWKV